MILNKWKVNWELEDKHVFSLEWTRGPIRLCYTYWGSYCVYKVTQTPVECGKREEGVYRNTLFLTFGPSCVVIRKLLPPMDELKVNSCLSTKQSSKVRKTSNGQINDIRDSSTHRQRSSRTLTDSRTFDFYTKSLKTSRSENVCHLRV